MAEFTLEVLKDEIVNDPNVIGYKNTNDTWTGGPNPPKGDQEIADLINDPANGAMIRRKNVNPVEIKQTVDQGDFNALSPDEVNYITWIVTGETLIDVRPDTIFNGLTFIFGPATATRAALTALLQKAGSRGEVLWGEDTVVTAGQVGRAFNEI